MGEPALQAVPATAPRAGTSPRVLAVCTANRCRSPIAAVALAYHLEALGRVAEVTSAGLLQSGERMPPDGIAAMRAHGIDLSEHRSTRLDGRMIADATLVVALAREHAREVVARVPEAWPRTFTLRQLPRWLAERPRPRHADLGPWLDVAAADRPRTVLIGRSREDDVTDPIGRPADVWEAVIRTIDADAAAVARMIAPMLPPAAVETP